MPVRENTLQTVNPSQRRQTILPLPSDGSRAGVRVHLECLVPAPVQPTPSRCSALRFVSLVALVLGLSTLARSQEPQPLEIWLAPDGVDSHPGTRDQPLGSLPVALRRAREWRRSSPAAAQNGIRIRLRGGVYRLDAPLPLHAEDSGTETSPTLVEAAPSEHPVLSGGIPIRDWRRWPDRPLPLPTPKSAEASLGSARPQPGDISARLPSASRARIWVAAVPKIGGRIPEFRQLWVAGRKAVRTRQPNGDSLDRLLSWDRPRERAWIPAGTCGRLRDPAGVEMMIQQQWEIAVCRLRTLRLDGSRAEVTFCEPESRIEFEHPWPQPVLSPHNNAPFLLANAPEFLDEPGEWYQDLVAGRLYYWPRPGEDLDRDRVIAPVLETLVQIQGSRDHPVAWIQFRGIEFAHTTWLRPSRSGHVPLQAGMFLLDVCRLSPPGTAYHPGLDNLAWIGRPPAAVSVNDAHHLVFNRCRFQRLAAAGLDLESGTHDDVVEGCCFRDVGGNGIQLGKFSDPGVETHRPYNPADDREIVSRERLANNLLADCANEDWGCVGIAAGYGRDLAIEHNEMFDLPYTGISVGWGWNPATNCMSRNRIVANHVHDVANRLCDTAGIYTLSAQPGTVIAENSVHDLHLSPYVSDPNHWFYLYLDEGSSFITVRDNWCPAERFMKNANGPGNVWTNNGPAVSPEIKAAAGLEPAFRDLLSGNDEGSARHHSDSRPDWPEISAAPARGHPVRLRRRKGRQSYSRTRPPANSAT
jgi:hypothetical protein